MNNQTVSIIVEMKKHLQKLRKTYEVNPSGINLFFKITPETTIMPIEKLRPIRAREKGIKNAIKYMYKASQGERPKREPITITSSEDHANLYDILDGNSTWHVAKEIGMEHLPVVLK